MEGADGAEAPATGRSGGRRWLLVVAGAAAAAVMVLGVVLALALGGGGSGPAPAQVAAGGKAGKTRVHISSDPTGARVLWAGDLIGVTPVKIEPPGKRGSKVVYRIEKAGRRPARLQVVLDGKEQEHSVRLRLAKGE